MRKGFTLVELFIMVVMIAVLTAVMYNKTNTNQAGTTVTANGEVMKKTMTIEVLCPLTTVESVRDTISNVTRYDYFDSEMRVWFPTKSDRRYKSYPNTCVVREVTDGF